MLGPPHGVFGMMPPPSSLMFNPSNAVHIGADTASHRDPDSQWQPTYARHVSPKYAIVAIAGHQLIVEEGRWYEVNRLKVRGSVLSE